MYFNSPNKLNDVYFIAMPLLSTHFFILLCVLYYHCIYFIVLFVLSFLLYNSHRIHSSINLVQPSLIDVIESFVDYDGPCEVRTGSGTISHWIHSGYDHSDEWCIIIYGNVKKLFIYLYKTFVKRIIHKLMCFNALFIQ